MPSPTRILTAASIFGIGWWIAQWVRGLVATVRDDASRLGFEMMGIEIGLVAIAVSIAWLLPGRPSERLGLSRGVLPWSVVAALAVGTVAFSQAINAALQPTQVLEGSVIAGISRGTRHALGWGFLVAFVGSGLAPAIGEELLCRGLLQRTLARHAGPLLAVTASSLFFGWLHMELVHGAVATSIGLYLGLAAYWGDSTRPAIAGHALNNVAALLGSKGLLVIRAPIGVLVVGGVAIAAGALVWAYRTHRRATTLPPGEQASRPVLQPDAESTDS